ncbi:MAG: hypothetical protein WEC59_08245 [Salibacteraceae bacterium]
MKLLPFTYGVEHLNTSKKELLKFVRTKTHEDLPLITTNTWTAWGNSEIIDYGSEIYSDSFMIWKVPTGTHNKFFFTTLHATIKVDDKGTKINWHIRFNLWTNLFFILSVIASGFLFEQMITKEKEPELSTLLLVILPYVIFTIIFNIDLKGNLEFLEKIKKTFANIG